jgi:peptide methionine sulfoxide reductase MsrB
MSDTDKEQNAKAELKKRLTPMQYHVTQEKGTERYGYGQSINKPRSFIDIVFGDHWHSCNSSSK